MIELLRPWMLLLAPLPALAWWLLPPLPAKTVVSVPTGVRDLLVGLTRNNARRGANWPAGLVLRIIGWVALIIALAGPYTEGAPLFKPTGRNLLVAIDLSSSMDEDDMEIQGKRVKRHAVVNQLIGRFIGERQGDRVGLIAFGHEAFLVAPLSFDVGAVAAMLEELTIGLPGQRTDLGQAVGLAVQALRELPEEATRVVMLLSDGEDNSGALTGLDAARMAGEHAIKIYSIGFSANIDSDGAAVLREMAELTGGQYFAAQSAEALVEISDRIEAIETSTMGDDPDHVLHDWSAVAIVIALIALTAVGYREMRAA